MRGALLQGPDYRLDFARCRDRLRQVVQYFVEIDDHGRVDLGQRQSASQVAQLIERKLYARLGRNGWTIESPCLMDQLWNLVREQPVIVQVCRRHQLSINAEQSSNVRNHCRIAD